MRKICLLALLLTNALAPQVLAQDDDAKRGSEDPQPKDQDASIVDDRDEVEPAPQLPPAPPLPAAPPTPPVVTQNVEEPPPPSPPARARESSGFSLTEGRRRPGATFGFGAFRPEKIGKYNHYEYLYGKERISPYFYGGYYLFSYFVDIGLVGRLGYYHAEGHPLAGRPTLPLEYDLTTEPKDPEQKLGLTLIPTQFTVEAALSPFTTRWVVFRGWVGIERLYVQETIESPEAQADDKPYTTSGFNQGLVTGMMVSFGLTGLDSRSDSSLSSLGIDRYYLSLFAENITTTRDTFGNFDRKNYGIAFSFEGLR